LLKAENASIRVKERWRRASIPESHDPDPNLSTFAFLAETFSSHFICGFVLISGRHDPPALLIPPPLPTQLDLIQFHDDLPPDTQVHR
jgi:hypothetical protein